jgi:putative SOS response-associated peptidase YedK
MCGRYNRFATIHQIADQFNAKPVGDLVAPPTYNAAPSTWHPVIRLNDEGEREIVNMRWGLVPYWAKDDKPNFSTINARAETIMISNTYRNAMRERRCLVPVNGFYEWQKREKGKKQAYNIGLKSGEAFAFAGLWEAWKRPDGSYLETYTIITSDPNEMTSRIHDRMPVIIDPKDYKRWLEPGDPQRPPIDLLRPYPAELMHVWKVGPEVGNVRNDHPGLLDPCDDDDDELPGLFE